MPAGDVDRAVISAVLKYQTVEGLKDELILAGDCKNTITFIRDFHKNYGKYPDAQTVQQSVKVQLYPDAEIVEPLSYYLDKLRERWELNALTQGMASAMDKVKVRDPAAARTKLLETVVEIGKLGDGEVQGLVDMRANTQERWDAYKERTKYKTIPPWRIPTPWEAMNHATMGVGRGEIWFVIARIKTGKCLREGTLVTDPVTGRRFKIEDVVNGKRSVLTLDEGKIKPVVPSRYWNNGVKPCMRLVTRLGRVLEATTNEPMLTPDGWVNLDALKPLDRIAAVAKIPEPLRPVKMDDDWLVVLAGMLAEGGMTGHRSSFTNFDKEVVDLFDASVKAMGCRLSPVKGREGQFDVVGTEWRKNSVLEMTRDLKIRSLSKCKKIPDEVFSLPDDQLEKFLGFFWSCDGSIETRGGRATVGLASEIMIDQLQHLLLRFGVVARKRYKMVKLNGKEFDSWELAVAGQSKDVFRETIGKWIVGPKARRFSNMSEKRKPNNDNLRSTPKLLDTVKRAVASKGTWSDFWGWYGWRSGPHESAGIRGLVSPHSGLIPRVKLRALAEWSGSEELRRLTSEDIVWDEVVSVSSIGDCQTFDLTVDGTHCFEAAGLVVHNSWFMVALANHFWKLGYKVLLVTMEMPVKKIQQRLDAVNAELPYNAFRKGQLDETKEKQYAEHLAEMKDKNQVPLWVAGDGKVNTVRDLEALVGELKPDVVCIDGVYKIAAASRSNSRWEKVGEVVDDLQKLSIRMDVGVVATSQFNRKVNKKDIDAGAGEVGFAYEIGMNADALIGIFQDGDMKENNRMLVRLLECREGETVNLFTEWDLELMRFSQVREVSDKELATDAADDKEDSQIDF